MGYGDGRVVEIDTNSAIIQGNITLSGSAQQVSTNKPCKVVTIQANPDNAAYVYVGNASVSTTVHMAVLTPGSSATFTVSNLKLLYVRGTAADKVSYGGEA